MENDATSVMRARVLVTAKEPTDVAARNPAVNLVDAHSPEALRHRAPRPITNTVNSD